jgi:hypothetical protein
MINVQTDPSTTDTKETIIETVAQSSSSEPENLDTSSESIDPLQRAFSRWSGSKANVDVVP